MATKSDEISQLRAGRLKLTDEVGRSRSQDSAGGTMFENLMLVTEAFERPASLAKDARRRKDSLDASYTASFLAFLAKGVEPKSR